MIAECDTEMTEPVQSTLNIEKGNNSHEQNNVRQR